MRRVAPRREPEEAGRGTRPGPGGRHRLAHHIHAVFQSPEARRRRRIGSVSRVDDGGEGEPLLLLFVSPTGTARDRARTRTESKWCLADDLGLVSVLA